MKNNTIYHSFEIQKRVVYALLMREIITRFGRHNIGFLWLFVEPMLFTLGIMALWIAADMNHGSNLSIVTFAITGYSSVLLWRNAATRCSKAIEPNLSLFYHRNVKVLDVFVARLILEIAGATMSLIVLSIFFISVNWMDFPKDIFSIIIGWLLLSWFAVAFGFIVGVISELSETFERMWHVLTYLLFPISGAAFMVDWLPKIAQDIVLWLPMVHGTEMIRHGYFGNDIITHEDPIYFISINLLLTLIGLMLVRKISYKVLPE